MCGWQLSLTSYEKSVFIWLKTKVVSYSISGLMVMTWCRVASAYMESEIKLPEDGQHHLLTHMFLFFG